MKIAIIDYNEHPVTNTTGFGVEIFVYLLIKGLMKKNHQVTLFASGDSEVHCKIVSIHPKGTALDSSIPSPFIKYYQDFLFATLYKEANNYDIIHTQDPIRGPLFSAFTAVPTVTTFHDVWENKRVPLSLIQKLTNHTKNHHFVSISKFQQETMSKTLSNPYLIYHGIDLDLIQPSYAPSGEYILYLGRINNRKGVELLPQIAQHIKREVKTVGFTHHNFEKALLDNLKQKESNFFHIVTGISDQNEKFSFYGNAKLFIFPILWEEPFGLVTLEAMASGTPVVAFAKGSVPEIIKDGETGFIVNPQDEHRGSFIVKQSGEKGLIEAIERIFAMPKNTYEEMRRNCRKYAENHFSVEEMVKNYERLYFELSQNKAL